MGLMDWMMDRMINMMPKKKREQMMINMMPLMMEGINMNKLMPRMMENMFRGVTADDVVNYLKESLKDKDTLNELGAKLQEHNLMQAMMIRSDDSTLGFDETVSRLEANAKEAGWQIPEIRDLQQDYHDSGLTEMTKCKILYFCYPQGGFQIFSDDDKNKPLSVMMPMGVSVFETSDGKVKIAAMNLSLMSNFFGGTVGEVLQEGGQRYQNSIKEII
jgi:uncharacterized protein (DUF302 family)